MDKAGCCSGGDGDKRSATRELNEREYFHLIDKVDHHEDHEGRHEDKETTIIVGEGQQMSTHSAEIIIVESMQGDFVVYTKAGKQEQDNGCELRINKREKNIEATNEQLNFDSNESKTKIKQPVIINDVLSELCTDTKMEHKLFQSKLHFLPSVDGDLTKRFNSCLLEGDGLHQSILQKSDSTEKNAETTGCLLDAVETNSLKKLKLSTSNDKNYYCEVREPKNDCDVEHWICNGTWMHLTKDDENVQKSNDYFHVSMSDSSNTIQDTQQQDSLTNKFETATLQSSSSTTYLSLSPLPEIIEIDTNNYISSDKINYFDQKLFLIPSTITTTTTCTTNISTNIIKDCSPEEEEEDDEDEEIYYQPEGSDNDVSAPQIFNVDDMSDDHDETPGPSHSKSIVSSIYHPAHTESLLSNDVDDDDDDDDDDDVNDTSGCMSWLSGIDSDRRSLETELTKCEGMKVSLQLNHDFDGDRNGLEEEEEGVPIEMDVLWANRKYIRGDEYGKKEIIIPQDSLPLSTTLDSPCGDDEDVMLQMKLRRANNGRRRRRGSPQNHARSSFPNLTTTPALNSSTDVEEPITDESGSSTTSVLSNNESSSVLHFGGSLVVGSEDGLSLVSSSLGDERVTESEVEDEESICDVEYMGRWDIFWPLMTKSQRKMVGAPPDIDLLWQTTETKSFIEQPPESNQLFERTDEGKKVVQGVEIEEILDESSTNNLNKQ